MTIDTQKLPDIASRLRCKYPMGPIDEHGEPEFGWRDFSGPAPEGVAFPTPLMLEAANHIDAQAAEIARLREALSDACAHLAGAASAYRTYASRKIRIGLPRASADPFFTTRVEDFEKAAQRARTALSGEGK